MHDTQQTVPQCTHCGSHEKARFDHGFSMAFQPIFDCATGEIFAHEALARGVDGAGASEVIAQVTTSNRYSFDQNCRTKAIQMASQLGLDGRLSINCMPNAILDPINCLRTTIVAARKHAFPTHRLIFEFTETEKIEDIAQFRSVINAFRHLGFTVAFDDFGAGHANLGLLSDVQPDVVKLDMSLVRGIDRDRTRAAIVDACLRMCAEIEIDVVAEGIETVEEFMHLRDAGVRLFQGYLFGKPQFEGLLHVSDVRLPYHA